MPSRGIIDLIPLITIQNDPQSSTGPTSKASKNKVYWNAISLTAIVMKLAFNQHNNNNVYGVTLVQNTL